MNRPAIVPEAAEAVERNAARIEHHLVQLAHGHDPFGHLFAIERLARAARADWCAAARQGAAGRPEW